MILRSPASIIYPNNPTKQSYWSKYGGLNSIIPTGLKQCYDLGVYVKSYYANFLSSTYDKSKLYAQSTDIDRTLQSAMAFLSGLYQPNADFQWNPYVLSNWLPIPVHTLPLISDPVYSILILNLKFDK